MNKELTKDFILRQRNNNWRDLAQLNYLEKLWNYVNEAVPGLPEPYSRCSDGDSYAIYWETPTKYFWADVYRHGGFTWFFKDDLRNQVVSWDEFYDEAYIPCDIIIQHIKLLKE